VVLGSWNGDHIRAWNRWLTEAKPLLTMCLQIFSSRAVTAREKHFVLLLLSTSVLMACCGHANSILLLSPISAFSTLGLMNSPVSASWDLFTPAKMTLCQVSLSIISPNFLSFFQFRRASC
jgi:hypothetical protein